MAAAPPTTMPPHITTIIATIATMRIEDPVIMVLVLAAPGPGLRDDSPRAAAATQAHAPLGTSDSSGQAMDRTANEI